MDNLILTNEENGILTITLNRFEKKNALTSNMYSTLCQLFDYASNSNVCCIVIQGNDQCFCAGNDLKYFLHAEPDEELAAFKFIKVLAQFNKPIVVAVAGPAIGLGTTLLLHADIVIAANNSKFSLPFSQLGFCPEAASSLLLPKLVGHIKAFELLALGESFDAEQALSMQLINQIVSPRDLLATAQHYANKIVALPNDSLMTTRILLKTSNQQLINQAMYRENSEFSRLLQTQECKAILSQFLNK